MIYVYFGHHKCASQYIKAVFLQTTALMGLASSRVDNFSAELPLGYHTREPYISLLAAHRSSLLHDPAAVVCLTNGDLQALELLDQRGGYRGFHVIRDPRDVLVSAYFSHLFSHPIRSDGGWIAEFRRQLEAAADIEQGLLLEMDFNATIFASMQHWDYANSRVVETRYERLVLDPVSEFARVFNFLGFDTPRLGLATLAAMALDTWRLQRFMQPRPVRTTLPELALRRVIQRNAFEKLTRGRQPGQENMRHHYRKGVAGDWRTYFSPELKTRFKDRYGDLLIRLGYEKDGNW